MMTKKIEKKVTKKKRQRWKIEITDLKVILGFIILLFLLFLLQPGTWSFLLNSSSLPVFLITSLKTFILEWLLPFTTLIIALLAYRNITLTKKSVAISADTLKQMQLADRKNTSPMLKFKLSIGEQTLSPHIPDEDRPREIKLWASKGGATEKESPHFLNLFLENLQEHPHGVAVDVSLTIRLEFPPCEGESGMNTEEIEINYRNMDSKEIYKESIIKISGITSLKAEIIDISYRDMFNKIYVIGYGEGLLEMKEDYRYVHYFTSLSGKTPDEANS